MLTHALADVGRTCWWLDAEDGGGTGRRAKLLRTYLCNAHVSQVVLHLLLIAYGYMVTWCAHPLWTLGQTMCGTSRGHMVRMCENQKANSHAAWLSAPSKPTNTRAILQWPHSLLHVSALHASLPNRYVIAIYHA